MRWLFYTGTLALALAVSFDPTALAQHGGHGGSHGGGGGGHATPHFSAPAHTPSFSRPAGSFHAAAPPAYHASSTHGFVPSTRPYYTGGARPPSFQASHPVYQTRTPNYSGFRPATGANVNRWPAVNNGFNNQFNNRNGLQTYNNNRVGVVGNDNRVRINNDNRLRLNQRFTTNNFNATRWNNYYGGNRFYGANRLNGGNRWAGGNRPWWNRPGYWNHNWYANRPAWYWGRPWYWNHWNWHHGYWNYWNRLPGFWYGSGLASSWLLGPSDTYVYSNPYYVASDVVEAPTYLNYSVPIPVPTGEQATLAYPPGPPESVETDADMTQSDAWPTTEPPPADTSDPGVAAANQQFDAARAAFKSGDYATAQQDVEVAIKDLPSDATLHEFRALCLFAQGKYQEAAAGLYAVLSAGPGWDWDTLLNLYPSADGYTQQLRNLEAFVRGHANTGYAHFLLAYHYLVINAKDAAVRQLEATRRIQPKDKLAAALLKSLTSGGGQAPGDANMPPPPGGNEEPVP